MAACPDFLVVGAMKAGTTTLYRDLIRHPDVFMPAQKEPETLVRRANAEEMRADYAALFSGAGARAIKGEASTAYTKRPLHDHIAERALEVCGPGLKIIYMRRDPVERIVSHYLHERQHGRLNEDLERAIRESPDLIDFSRYAWQIQPWIDAFGADHVLQIDLEAFAKDRAGVVATVLRHIGADPRTMPAIDARAVANTAAEVKIPRASLVGRLLASDLYQRRLKKLMSPGTRERLRRRLFPSRVEARPRISAAAQAFIVEQLRTPRGS